MRMLLRKQHRANRQLNCQWQCGWQRSLPFC
nr:MAG TPA: hypothetical protein [Caudoviricetes sp.]